jgi:hypothetical protein
MRLKELHFVDSNAPPSSFALVINERFFTEDCAKDPYSLVPAMYKAHLYRFLLEEFQVGLNVSNIMWVLPRERGPSILLNRQDIDDIKLGTVGGEVISLSMFDGFIDGSAEYNTLYTSMKESLNMQKPYSLPLVETDFNPFVTIGDWTGPLFILSTTLMVMFCIVALSSMVMLLQMYARSRKVNPLSSKQGAPALSPQQSYQRYQRLTIIVSEMLANMIRIGNVVDPMGAYGNYKFFIARLFFGISGPLSLYSCFAFTFFRMDFYLSLYSSMNFQLRIPFFIRHRRARVGMLAIPIVIIAVDVTCTLLEESGKELGTLSKLGPIVMASWFLVLAVTNAVVTWRTRTVIRLFGVVDGSVNHPGVSQQVVRASVMDTKNACTDDTLNNDIAKRPSTTHHSGDTANTKDNSKPSSANKPVERITTTQRLTDALNNRKHTERSTVTGGGIKQDKKAQTIALLRTINRVMTSAGILMVLEVSLLILAGLKFYVTSVTMFIVVILGMLFVILGVSICNLYCIAYMISHTQDHEAQSMKEKNSALVHTSNAKR